MPKKIKYDFGEGIEVRTLRDMNWLWQEKW